MTCDDCRRDIVFYAGGQLSPAEASAIEGHLRECQACRRELEEERTFTRNIRNASAQFRRSTLRVGEHFSHERRTDTVRRARPARIPGSLAQPRVAMAAYLALCIAAAVLIFSRAPEGGVDRVVSWAVEHYPLIDQTHPLHGDAETVRAWFKEHHGIDVVPPRGADYSALTGCKMTEIDAKPAPLLRFEGKDTSAVFMLPAVFRAASGPWSEPFRIRGYIIRVWSEGDNSYLEIARESRVI